MIKIDLVERHLFFEGILIKYGYDFRQYAEASLDRRLVHLLQKYKTDSLIEILKKCLESPDFFRSVLPSLTINTTEFFRDPLFFKALGTEVLPTLKTYPKLSIWIAGCSTGEEVLSLAILLAEHDLLARCTIYATDINKDVLKKAKDGIYDADCIGHFNSRYLQAGGSKTPSDYYSTDYGLVRFHRDLLTNVVFTEHNLATDAVFIEAHLILCRNVLIYFSRELQDRVFNLFARSLTFKGFMGIGSKESVRYSTSSAFFEAVDADQNIFNLKSRALTSDALTPGKR